MAKLVKFKDGKVFCWYRVDLDNGEPIWIGVMGQNVIVKKSKSKRDYLGKFSIELKLLTQLLHLKIYIWHIMG